MENFSPTKISSFTVICLWKATSSHLDPHLDYTRARKGNTPELNQNIGRLCEERNTDCKWRLVQCGQLHGKERKREGRKGRGGAVGRYIWKMNWKIEVERMAKEEEGTQLFFESSIVDSYEATYFGAETLSENILKQRPSSSMFSVSSDGLHTLKMVPISEERKTNNVNKTPTTADYTGHYIIMKKARHRHHDSKHGQGISQYC